MEFTQEEWKPIEGFRGKYEVSNIGRVKSNNYHREKREKILKPYTDTGGYYMVNLCFKGVRYPSRVHRLVANTFIPNPENKPYIDHVDTNRTNNRIENLKWCTMKENHQNKKTIKNHSKASKVSWSKGVYNKRLKPILQYTLDGIFVKRYNSITEAGKAIGKNSVNIGYCARMTDKNLTAHGFIWCAENDTQRIIQIETQQYLKNNRLSKKK
jgi:hypothetical protein